MAPTSRKKSNCDAQSGIGRVPQCAIESLSAIARLLGRLTAREVWGASESDTDAKRIRDLDAKATKED